MRVRVVGSFVNVSVSEAEVRLWKTRWPGSGLPSRRITFQFDRDGSLIDIWPYWYADLFDGAAAVALSQDAQAYGLARLARRR